MFAALRARNYFLYWIGLVFYVLGHRAEYVTLAWITWELTQEPPAPVDRGPADLRVTRFASSGRSAWPIARSDRRPRAPAGSAPPPSWRGPIARTRPPIAARRPIVGASSRDSRCRPGGGTPRACRSPVTAPRSV